MADVTSHAVSHNACVKRFGVRWPWSRCTASSSAPLCRMCARSRDEDRTAGSSAPTCAAESRHPRSRARRGRAKAVARRHRQHAVNAYVGPSTGAATQSSARLRALRRIDDSPPPRSSEPPGPTDASRKTPARLHPRSTTRLEPTSVAPRPSARRWPRRRSRGRECRPKRRSSTSRSCVASFDSNDFLHIAPKRRRFHRRQLRSGRRGEMRLDAREGSDVSGRTRRRVNDDGARRTDCRGDQCGRRLTRPSRCVRAISKRRARSELRRAIVADA